MDAELQKLVNDYRTATATAPTEVQREFTKEYKPAALDFFEEMNQPSTDSEIDKIVNLLLRDAKAAQRVTVQPGSGKAVRRSSRAQTPPASAHGRKSFLVDDLPDTGALPKDVQSLVDKIKAAPPDKTLTERIADCFSLKNQGYSGASGYSGEPLQRYERDANSVAQVVTRKGYPPTEEAVKEEKIIGDCVKALGSEGPIGYSGFSGYSGYSGYSGLGGSSATKGNFFSPVHSAQSWKVESKPSDEETLLDKQVEEYRRIMGDVKSSIQKPEDTNIFKALTEAAEARKDPAVQAALKALTEAAEAREDPAVQAALTTWASDIWQNPVKHVAKIGSVDRPATDEEIADMQENLKAVAQDPDLIIGGTHTYYNTVPVGDRAHGPNDSGDSFSDDDSRLTIEKINDVFAMLDGK
jgi:hypothetical protein